MTTQRKHPVPVKRGYPKKMTFKTLQEVNDYLECDRLVCLLCGHDFMALHKHIQLCHEMTADQYKELYGIPWRKGLVAKPLREKQARIINKQRKDGVLPQSPSKEHIAKLVRVAVPHRRPITDAARRHYSEHALRQHNRTEKWGRKDFEEYLRRIKSGRTITEAGKDMDMPCREVFGKYCAQNPDFAEKFEKAWNAVPFDVQVRGQKTGERLKRKVVELRSKGLSWPDIGRIMKIKGGTAQNTWFRLKNKGQLQRYLPDQ